MTIENLQKNVLPLLSNSKPTSIKFLANKLFVSESTARRYANELFKSGLVIRTHGGIIPCAKANADNLSVYERFLSKNEVKDVIAKKASEYVKDGYTIFLDSSSTVFHIVPYLAQKNNLTVVTSSLKTATALVELNIKTLCLGGEISSNLSTNSAYALSLIEKINADLFLFSCDAIDEKGNISDNSFDECVLRCKFLQNSKFSILLLDSEKLNKRCKYNLCDSVQVDKIISNNLESVVELK